MYSLVFRLSKSRKSVSQRCPFKPLHLIPLDAWDPLRKGKAHLANAAPENVLKLLAVNSLSFRQCHTGLPFPWHCRDPLLCRCTWNGTLKFGLMSIKIPSRERNQARHGSVYL